MRPLPPAALYRLCDPARFRFGTTAELFAQSGGEAHPALPGEGGGAKAQPPLKDLPQPPLTDLLELPGQERAIEAVRFGIGIRHQGYNIFALGPTGLGKHRLIRQLLTEQARQEPTPDDFCYVNHFGEAQKPRALRLPPGRGGPLKKEMERLIEELRVSIPAAFESDDYRARKALLEKELEARHEQAFGALQKRATEHGIALLRTPAGLALGPLAQATETEDEDAGGNHPDQDPDHDHANPDANVNVDVDVDADADDPPESATPTPSSTSGEIMTPEAFAALPEEQRQRIQHDVSELQAALQAAIQAVPRWQREIREKERALGREVITHAVTHLFEDVRARYADLPQVLAHLDAVQKDLSDRVDDFLPSARDEDGEGEGEESPAGALPEDGVLDEDVFRAYRVNVLTDHTPGAGAPVVYEDHPTHPNLIGRVEHQAQYGALVTDFNLIRPGALHRANGGYLLLDARKVLEQPLAWEELKRALRSRKVKIESIEQAMSLVSTVSLEPEPLPLDIKVVLLGDPLLYYVLFEEDPDFPALFKVAADFAEHIDRTPEGEQLYARLLGRLAQRSGLLPLRPEAVARVIEHAARLCEDAEKLSTHLRSLSDLLCEADYFGRQAGLPALTAAAVQQAIDAQVRRGDRLHQLMKEEIQRGTVLIDTAGEVVGQVNGLTVMELGQIGFGRPIRITARVRLGRGEVVDIERAVELGGPVHSKGVLILQSYLGARYAEDMPLCLSASLVLEQSYHGVEGDSASSAELYALLSALAGLPAQQGLAVTGSVNQLGQIQAIGGVNEKIEGFFDICRQRGLSGQQGVLIPGANVKNLMLRHDVVAAVEDGRFHVYPVETVDQGIELLCGVPAGERGADGRFPPGSVNQRVEARLRLFCEQARRFTPFLPSLLEEPAHPAPLPRGDGE